MEPTESGLAGAFSPDLRHYLRIVWRRRWAFLACLIAIPAIVLAFSLHSPNVYQSSTLMQVSGGNADGAPASSATLGDAPPSPTAVEVAARLIQTSGVARSAGQSLRPKPADSRGLLGQISVSTDDTSGFLTLTAQDHSSARAADIANAFSNAVVENQITSAVMALDQSIGQLEAQVAALSDPVQKRQLSSQLQRLRALRAVQSSNIFQVEPAVPSHSPVSPRPIRNTLLALIVAVLVGLGVVLLIDRLDSRIREPDELEEQLDVPLLAVVPREAFRPNPSSAVREAFQTLRMSLTYFNVDRELHTVLVTSALKAEGKTTVAVHLALAAARAGRDVILLETDLRRPAIADRLRLEPEYGLSDVLVGNASLFDALIDCDVNPQRHPTAPENPVDGRLRVLTCGALPPNPSELLGSARMRTLLRQLSGAAELTIIDTAPLLAVSDAIPLVAETSGLIVVGRLNVARREAIRRLRKVVATAQGTMLGVVATGAGQGGIYGYGGYGDYLSPPAAAAAAAANGHHPEAEVPAELAANQPEKAD